jgi:tellurite methyltransferase
MKSDREKWDKRYETRHPETSGPDPFLADHVDILQSGRALDVACGLGSNALFLAEHGFSVDAVDISFPAVSRLHAEARVRGLDVACFVADLDEFALPCSRYDVVTVFQFFSEPLISQIKSALKPGGTVVYATFNSRHTSVKPGFNPAFLIPPDALSRHFSDFDLLVHEPSAGDHGNMSRLIGRKPR